MANNVNASNAGPVIQWGGVQVWANNPWTCGQLKHSCPCDVCRDYRDAQRQSATAPRRKTCACEHCTAATLR